MRNRRSNIDLNQLALLHELMLERRVSRVAHKLGLTQPAVSNALARLRRHFGDELFVPTPAGMVPTPLAERLAAPVGAGLALIHGALAPAPGFDPATAHLAFTVGMTDIGEIVFLPRLLQHLREVAPGVSLSTVRNTAVDLAEELAQGRVDLAIGLLPQLQAGFHQRRLFRQRHVLLCRQGHALDVPRPGLAGYRAAEHLVVVAAGTGHGQVDTLLQRAGVLRRVRLTVPHFVSVGHLLQRSELVATVPERLAAELATPFGLVARPLPVKLPEVEINAFWHARLHRSDSNRWLRDTVFTLFGQAG
ncbi:MAG: LysR family transcriptional regulator [Burkholderiaceae bacterium]|nr:LysR family transcriptional regulator [Rhodoferax sp.]MCP5283533.1 LysR family transcriptional regulator [Burkholderiaceae bacterium]